MPYVDSGGVQIYFETVGDGFPVVLHTGGGGDGRMWQEAGYLDGLKGFRCITVDHRGHGRSGKSPGLENHFVERYVTDVLAILDSLGMLQAAFWGYSSGATVGFAMAASHPERLAALIASGGVGPRDYDDPVERREVEAQAGTYRRKGLRPLIEQLETEEGIRFPDWFWQQMTETDAEMFTLERLGEANWHGPLSLLPTIRAPVLMLVGELEDPDGNSARAVPQLRDGRCVTFRGLGHVGAYLRSDLALAEAVPFLKRVAD
jgi:pimeloyl-ACP methyl ester carboxylesterase